jgi:hypothetical protein
MNKIVIYAGVIIVGIIVASTVNSIVFSDRGLVHYLKHHNETMEIPATSPANTHCFFADDLGVQLTLEVSDGNPIPTRIDLNDAQLQDMRLSAHKAGYGEVFLYNARIPALYSLETDLTEVQCIRH